MSAGVRLGKICLVVAAILLVGPQVVLADDVSPVFIDAAGLDPVGDSPNAPDIGKVQHSVHLEGALRAVVIGVWLNRSDLAEGEQVNVFFNSKAGGQPDFGADFRVVQSGHSPSADTHATYVWVAATTTVPAHWASQSFNASVEAKPDGRMYFRVNFDPPATDPASLGLRVTSTTTGGVVQGPTFDAVPDYPAFPNMFVSLGPHGLPDPLEGCTYDGGCVGPASGPSQGGPAPNPGGGGEGGGGGSVGSKSAGGGTSAACTQARKKLRAAKRRLARANRALARASTRAAKRRQLRRVRRLRQTRSKWKRAVTRKC